MRSKKIILGLEEEVKIFVGPGKFVRRRAKIDTGARTTAIDISIANRIGMGNVYTQFQKHLPKLKITAANFKEMRHYLKSEVKPQLKKIIPGLYDIDVLPAANGITVRPYIKFHFHLRNKHIHTIASIVDRKILIYPVLVGKRDMAGFLIDPTKNVYKVA